MYDSTESYDNKVDIVQQATKCINNWNGYYSQPIVTAKFMRNFCYLSSWTAAERRARGNRATLDFNNLQTLIRALIAEQREADPQQELMPVNQAVSPRTIATRTDLMRYISLKSNSKIVYQTAYKDALDCGYGAILVDTEYENADTFNQKIVMKPVKDVLTCGWDVNAEHPNKTDGDSCFYQLVMSVQEYKRRWPKASVASASTPISPNTQAYSYTQNSNTAYVTVYFHKEYYNKTVSLLENGESYTKEGYKKYVSEMKKKRKNLMTMKSRLPAEIFDELYEMTEISKVVETRQSTDFRIKRSFITSTEELETGDFPGKLMPLVYTEGFSTIINGMQIPIPFAKCAVDAQRVMNYAGSEIADSMTKARKEQWLATPRQIAGVENIWSHPENVQGVLQYNPDPTAQSPAPFPIQQTNVLSNQYQQYYQQMQSDVRTITGRYSENAGDGSDVQSGKAVIAKQVSGNLSVGVYADNLLDAIAETGRVINGLINEIYDTDRTVTVLGKDKKTRIERLNYYDEMPKYKGELEGDEWEEINNMTKGEYEVTISAGGSFAAQQQLAFNQTMQLMQASQSEIFPYLADILPQLINIPQSNEISKRMRDFVVPPSVVAMDKNEPPPPPPPPSIQDKIELAAQIGNIKEIDAQIKTAEATDKKATASIVNSLTSVMIENSKLKGQEAASIAEVTKAITSSQAEELKSIAGATKSAIDSDADLLRKENEVLKNAMGIN